MIPNPEHDDEIDEFEKYDLTEKVGDYQLNHKNNMNDVSVTDVTLMSLAIGDFSTAASFLGKHDFVVAGGLVVIGIILVYLYHRMGS